MSYSSSEEGIARLFDKCVRLMGGAAFVASRDIPIGTSFQGVLKNQIANTDEMILVVTPAYVQSIWCQWELAIAASRDITIAPILFGCCADDLVGFQAWRELIAFRNFCTMDRVDTYLEQLHARVNASARSAGQTDVARFNADTLREIVALANRGLDSMQVPDKEAKDHG